jgi:excisionase family DNA binding protein
MCPGSDVNEPEGDPEMTVEPALRQPTGGRPALWTVTEVASALRVSKMTIYRMMHSGELPHVRVSGSYRIPDEAVQELMQR